MECNRLYPGKRIVVYDADTGKLVDNDATLVSWVDGTERRGRKLTIRRSGLAGEIMLGYVGDRDGWFVLREGLGGEQTFSPRSQQLHVAM